MKTRIYSTKQIKLAAKDIQNGEVVAFPTETVYGVGADATNPSAVKKVFKVKHRPRNNPLNVTVDGLGMVKKYAKNIPAAAQKLIKRFWPGPLTIILSLKPGTLSSVINGGLTTIAFRDPDTPVTLKLIQEAGVPIVGPSGNISGKPSPTLPQHVMHDMKGKIAGIIDGGECNIGIDSTVIDMTRKIPLVLRPGTVTIKQLEDTINGKVQDITKLHPSVVRDQEPSSKLRHYATSSPVLIVKKNQWKDVAKWARNQEFRIGVMATDDVLKQVIFPSTVNPYRLGAGIKDADRRFFGGLRYFDAVPAIKYILVQAFPDQGISEGYMDRLNNSANKKYFEKTILNR
ncbi:MAG: threonylcarbamoyl-AMP synthase [Acetilactobacillus jinshanensis]